ncbi:MAG: TIGR04255 family protein [Gammaproteobacteria bacterium]
MANSAAFLASATRSRRTGGGLLDFARFDPECLMSSRIGFRHDAGTDVTALFQAPIAEAVISLGIEATGRFDSARFSRLADALPGYPTRLPIKAIQMGVSADTASLAFHNAHEEVGLRLESSDGRRVLQLQKHEFTFSHLHPYSSWDEFAAEGKQLWPLFASAAGAERVVRAAVRVINKLELPVPIRDLSQYVSLLPMLPSALAGPPDTFFMQLQFSMAHLVPGCRCVVNVASGSQPETALGKIRFDSQPAVAALAV